MSNTLLMCPTISDVKQNTVSTLVFNIHLLNFPLSTCCGRIMPRSVYPFSAISWREQVTFRRYDTDVHFAPYQYDEFEFSNSMWVDILLHSRTWFWFQANQSLFLLYSAVCLPAKYQFYSFADCVFSKILLSFLDCTVETAIFVWLLL